MLGHIACSMLGHIACNMPGRITVWHVGETIKNMNREVKLQMGRILNVEYSAIQGSYWMIYGVICSFASVFLLNKGYSNSEIGIILAAANVLSVVIQPLVADFADRSKKLSLVSLLEIMTVIMMIMTAGLFAFEKKTLALAVIFVLLTAWHTTLQPLISSLCFKLQETGNNVSFGIGRSMGSFFYAVLVAFLGNFVEKKGIDVLPISAEIVMAMLLISVIMTGKHFGKAKEMHEVALTRDLRNMGKAGAVEGAESAGLGESTLEGVENAGISESAGQAKSEPEEINLAEFIRRNKMFFVLNLGVLGIYFSNAVLNFFTMQIVAGVGGNSADLGGVMSVMAFLEIPPMIFFGFLRKKFSCETMLKFSGLMFTVKIGAIGMARSVGLIYAAQFLQPFSFALFLPAMVNFINEIMSPGEAVKGQALYTMMITVTSVLASVIGGVILDLYSPKVLTMVATAVTFAGALIVIGCVDKVG